MESSQEEDKLSNPFNTSPKDFSTWNFDFSRYKIIKVIGSGAYGTVCEGVQLQTGRAVAIKRITNLFVYPIETKRVLREISLLRLLNHPNIVKLLDVVIEGDPETFNTIYMIMEYFPCDLKRLFNSEIYLNNSQIATIMHQSLQALDYLHGCQVIHRDIKPANILINEECTIKVCDFGLARSVNFELLDESPRNELKLEIPQSLSPKNHRLSMDFSAQRISTGSAGNSPDKIIPDPKLSHVDLMHASQKTDFTFTSSGLDEESPPHLPKLSPKMSCEEKIKKPFENDEFLAIKPFCLKLKKPKKPKKQILTKHVVSRWYRPPEIILVEPSYTYQIDIWSLGCIFGELQKMLKLNMFAFADRVPLFPGTSCFPLSPEIKKDKKKLVVKGNKDQLKEIFSLLGTPAERDHDFVSDPNSLNYLKSFKKMEKKDLRKVFPGSNAEAVDLLDKMLKFNPNARISAADGLEHDYFRSVKGKKPKFPAVKEKVRLKFDKGGVVNSKKMRNYFLEETAFYQK